MPLPPIKWLLIDLDNTLLDFDKAAGRSLEIAYQRFEISTHPENINLYKQINHECWSSFEQGHIDVTTLKDLRFRNRSPEAQSFLFAYTSGASRRDRRGTGLLRVGSSKVSSGACHQWLCRSSTTSHTQIRIRSLF